MWIVAGFSGFTLWRLGVLLGSSYVSPKNSSEAHDLPSPPYIFTHSSEAMAESKMVMVDKVKMEAAVKHEDNEAVTESMAVKQEDNETVTEIMAYCAYVKVLKGPVGATRLKHAMRTMNRAKIVLNVVGAVNGSFSTAGSPQRVYIVRVREGFVRATSGCG